MSAAVPLAGMRVLVPRDGSSGEQIGDLVRERGGAPVLVRLIKHAEPSDAAALHDAISLWNSGYFDWLVVTSARTVEVLLETGARRDIGRIAAVGPATAKALSEAGFRVALTPECEFTGEALGLALTEELRANAVPGGSARVLLPLSEIAEPTVERALFDAGHQPTRVTAYCTAPAPAEPLNDAALASELEAVLVFSASGARALATRFAPLPERTIIAAIGQPTARILTGLKMPPNVIATEHTAEGVVEELAAYCERLTGSP
ncbi:uroporphyrinogen-III synthase [Leucobacter sp. UT-8R-CII-1-4]|uniref:uroporphyrinogen-III synthase n=1 Tax=Leucobacter sp. UT-8R-CII-1-4 TaxID=3040075 RepID=UPI0024A9C312|nr:uroporphyrinogen-III synthase [Leucobacter sp. UT-8R-CII-1-4]MDI6022506.1 uroporphyrinogen-III synthase [Leucobacter sp. UT-8R-CII-1-4]